MAWRFLLQYNSSDLEELAVALEMARGQVLLALDLAQLDNQLSKLITHYEVLCQKFDQGEVEFGDWLMLGSELHHLRLPETIGTHESVLRHLEGLGHPQEVLLLLERARKRAAPLLKDYARLSQDFEQSYSNALDFQRRKFFAEVGTTSLAIPLSDVLQVTYFDSPDELKIWLSKEKKGKNYMVKSDFVLSSDICDLRSILPLQDHELLLVDSASLAVRCAGHGEQFTLLDAILGGWKECRHCHALLCPICQEEFGKQDICPHISLNRHELVLEGLGLGVFQHVVLATVGVGPPTKIVSVGSSPNGQGDEVILVRPHSRRRHEHTPPTPEFLDENHDTNFPDGVAMLRRRMERELERLRRALDE